MTLLIGKLAPKLTYQINEDRVPGIGELIFRPFLRTHNPVTFIRSNTKYSIFMGLDLHGILIYECQARDVDFQEANLSNADLRFTDFSNSAFKKTNLKGADFTNAVNYYIDVLFI